VTDRCQHFEDIQQVEAQSDRCQGCHALGATWTELRVCLTCGYVGCCEDSPHQHAQRHFETTGHPMIASLERGETWGWCYVDRRYFDPMPVPLPRRRSALSSLFARVFSR
jgi:uncharacterized UBP type Zn finger protein